MENQQWTRAVDIQWASQHEYLNVRISRLEIHQRIMEVRTSNEFVEFLSAIG